MSTTGSSPVDEATRRGVSHTSAYVLTTKLDERLLSCEKHARTTIYDTAPGGAELQRRERDIICSSESVDRICREYSCDSPNDLNTTSRQVLNTTESVGWTDSNLIVLRRFDGKKKNTHTCYTLETAQLM